MELELRNIEKRLCFDRNVIQRTVGTKLDIENAKIVVEYLSWKKI